MYVRAIDDIHRSLETGSTSKGPSIGPIRRDFVSVRSYTGVDINVPLKYLGSTAIIGVTGDEQCSIHGPSSLLVHIVNGVKVPLRTQGEIRSELANAYQGAMGKKIGDAVPDIMESRGVGKRSRSIGSRIAGKARNAVHGKIHSSLTKVGKSLGASFETTQAISNLASKTVGDAARKKATEYMTKGLKKLAGGTSVAAALLESTETGMGASRYDRSYSGKALDGTTVIFFIKGSAE